MTDDSGRDGRVSRRKFVLASGAVGLTALAGCSGSGGSGSEGPGGSGGSGGTTTTGDSTALSGTVDIAGSSTVFPLATALAREPVSEAGAELLDAFDDPESLIYEPVEVTRAPEEALNAGETESGAEGEGRLVASVGAHLDDGGETPAAEAEEMCVDPTG